MTSHQIGNKRIKEWLQSANISPVIGAEPASLKKIIDGKTYNTKTASNLACYAYDNSPNQYEWQWEYLYQTRGGAFFLVAEGMTEYTPYGAVLPGTNDYVRGHVLLPLDANQLKAWLEMRDLVEEYEEIYGEQDEEADVNSAINASYSLTLRLPLVLAQKVKSLCSGGESIQSFIQKAVEAACINHGQPSSR